MNPKNSRAFVISFSICNEKLKIASGDWKKFQLFSFSSYIVLHPDQIISHCWEERCSSTFVRLLDWEIQLRFIYFKVLKDSSRHFQARKKSILVLIEIFSSLRVFLRQRKQIIFIKFFEISFHKRWENSQEKFHHFFLSFHRIFPTNDYFKLNFENKISSMLAGFSERWTLSIKRWLRVTRFCSVLW